jgi:hypothetical protein
MNNCENCINDEMCNERERSNGPLPVRPCEWFKDVALYPKLPCRVGSIVYAIDLVPNEAIACEITLFRIDFSGVCGFSYEPLNKLKARCAGCDCNISEWEDTVFPTKEAAENKIRETANAELE